MSKNNPLLIEFKFDYRDYDFHSGGIDRETWKYINDNLDKEEMWDIVYHGVYEMIHERILDMLNKRDDEQYENRKKKSIRTKSITAEKN